MKESIFRKESLEKINSPGELNRYIRVAEPGWWVVLAAIMVLLLGVLAWGVFGTLETAIPAFVVADESGAACYFSEPEISRVRQGMAVRMDGGSGSVSSDAWAEFAPPAGVNLQGYDGVAGARVELDAPMDGVFEAEIILEQIAPISFLVQ